MVRTTGIERTLHGFWIAVVVLHVIGENHKLSDVGKTLELRVLKAFVDAVTLGQNTFAVIGLLHFDKHQRHTIDKQRDIGAEFFIAVLTG